MNLSEQNNLLLWKFLYNNETINWGTSYFCQLFYNQLLINIKDSFEKWWEKHSKNPLKYHYFTDIKGSDDFKLKGKRYLKLKRKIETYFSKRGHWRRKNKSTKSKQL